MSAIDSVVWGGIALVVLSLAFRWDALRGSWFCFDDLAFISRAANMPLDADYLLESYGGHLMPGGFLTTRWALDLWGMDWTPWMMVMLLAGLQTVPPELHEAAEIDGAGTVRRFFSITVPQLSGIIGLVLLLEFIWNFQHFDIIYVLTGGGPAGSTQTFATAVYETAFTGFDLGHAGALGLLWMVLLMGLVVVYVRFSEKGEKR